MRRADRIDRDRYDWHAPKPAEVHAAADALAQLLRDRDWMVTRLSIAREALGAAKEADEHAARCCRSCTTCGDWKGHAAKKRAEAIAALDEEE